MNNQNGTPYSSGTFNAGRIKSLSPMTMKIISMVLVLLTLLTFLMPWMQFSEDVLDELEYNDVDLAEYVEEALDSLPTEYSSSRRDAEEVAERITDGKFSLTDFQFVLGKMGEEINDAWDELEDQYWEYQSYGYNTSSLRETMDILETIRTANVFYQIIFFATLVLGVVSLVSYWLDRRYNGWGLTIGASLLLIASIVGVIFANDAIAEEAGEYFDDFFAVGVGGIFAVILAVAANIMWNMYLKCMPSGGVGIDAFKQAFAARQPIYAGAEQPPVNSYTTQPTPVQADIHPSSASDAPSAANEFMFCPMCGTKCAKDSRFCMSCGNTLPRL